MDGVSEHSTLRSTFGFMAFHGGALEEMTDIVASRAAERAGASYYGIQFARQSGMAHSVAQGDS